MQNKSTCRSDGEVAMAVASRGAALSALRSLINHDPVPASTLLQRPYLPDGIDPVADSVRIAPESLIGGYGNEAATCCRRRTRRPGSPSPGLPPMCSRTAVHRQPDGPRRYVSVQHRPDHAGRHHLGCRLSAGRLRSRHGVPIPQRRWGLRRGDRGRAHRGRRVGSKRARPAPRGDADPGRDDRSRSSRPTAAVGPPAASPAPPSAGASSV